MNNPAAIPGAEGMTEEQKQQMMAERVKMEELLKSSESVECKGCKGTLFNKATSFKRISALNPANQSGQEQYVEYPAIYCMSCNKELDLT